MGVARNGCRNDKRTRLGVVVNVVDLVFYCLGGALFRAVVFFPLTFVTMRSQFRFRGRLGQAWRPFGYSVIVLAFVEFGEIGIKTSIVDTDTTWVGLMSWLLIPILVCAAVLYFTYRDSHAPPPLPD